jgi:drug/metabolite transporter (DMT)-like permease
LSPKDAEPSRRIRLDGVAIAVVLACCLLWGLQQIVAKATMPAIPPLIQGGVRSGGAALLVWMWSALRGQRMFDRDGTLMAGLAAGVLFGLEFACIYLGLPLTSASRLIVFLYLAPFVVAIALPHFVSAERLDRLQSAGLVCAFLALAYAFQEGFGSFRASGTQLVGDGLGLLAGLLWGLTTLIVRSTRLSTASPEKALFYQLAVSCLILLGLSLVTGEAWPATLAKPAIASLVFQTVIVAFISYLAWFWLLRHYSATRISAFTFLTPVSGLVFGSLLLGEAVSPRIVTALLFVALGIYLVNRPVSHRSIAALPD